MSSLLHRSRRILACLAILTPLVAASAARADRGGVPHNGDGDAPMMLMQQAAYTPHTPCGQRVIEHPFAQWDDNADYFLVKQGDLSQGATEWDLGTGEIVADNNTYSLYTDEAASLSLGEGESATGPMVCVDPDLPTMRFFVRNGGAETGTLKVEAMYEDENFELQSIQLGQLTSADAGAEWTPSPTLELAAPLVALLEDGQAPVWFRFTAEGEGSSWQVDDVYVDPYGKG
jgi:hypothetical protein